MESSQNDSSTRVSARLKRQKQLTRRRFLKLVGYTSGGMGVAAGVEVLNRFQAATAMTPKVFGAAQQTMTAD